MSLINTGGQISLSVTPSDLHQFAESLLTNARKEWMEEQASAPKQEAAEEQYLTTEEVCKIFGVCQATLWEWHRKGYLRHVKWGSKNRYPLSAVNAVRHAQSKDDSMAGYCKRKSKVDKEMSRKEGLNGIK